MVNNNLKIIINNIYKFVNNNKSLKIKYFDLLMSIYLY